jgi:serine/threonine protein kinase
MLTLTPASDDPELAALLGEVARAEALSPEPGRGSRIGADLTLVARLGAGGHGSVWEAEHARLGRRVAVKLLHRRASAFLTEAALLERVRHPRIVRLLDFGVAEGAPFLVMELVEGETLAARVRRAGPLTPSEVGDVVAQLADALAEAHAHGVLHRDVKPSNVLLAAGGAIDARLIDFGVGGDLDRIGRGLAGTPRYMSREQLTAPERVDGRADLWALAACAYFALCGRHAFAAGDRERRAPLPPSALRPELWPEIDRWFERALCAAPARRFGTARAMVHAWRAALAARPRTTAELAALFGAAEARQGMATSAEAGAIDGRWLLLGLVALVALAAAVARTLL